MKKVPSYELVCALLDGEDRAWQSMKPLVKLALLAFPGLICGGFGTADEILASLSNGDTLNAVFDTVEAALFPIKQGFFREKPKVGEAYNKLRLVNGMLIFCAYFDIFSENNSLFWKKLKLTGDEALWLTETALEDHGHAEDLMGGDGRLILTKTDGKMALLEKFYALLNRRMEEFSKGLAATSTLRGDWDSYPALAAEQYQKQLVVLCGLSSQFKAWADWQTHERLLDGQREIKAHITGEVDRVIDAVNQNPPPKTEPLHLPLPRVLRADGFVGRKKQKEELTRRLGEGERPILSGPGGIGKTELAVHFAREYFAGKAYFVRFRESFYKTVCYGVSEGIPGLAGKALDEGQLYEIAMEKLLACGEDALLIIDNADADTGEFEDLLDETYRRLEGLPMRMLLTTRFEVTGAIEVGPLKNKELYQIFQRHGAFISKTEMDDLIEAVDRHTMTVDLMARMLVRSCKALTARELLDAIKNKKLSSQSRKISTDYNRDEKQRRIDEHLRAVFNVSGMSKAAKAVMACAVLLPENGMGAQSFGSALPEAQQAVLDELIHRGWLHLNGGLLNDRLLTIHPVIRLVCRGELLPTASSCKDFLDAVWAQYDRKDYSAEKYRQWAELFAMAAREVPDERGNWHARAGVFWSALGRPEEALQHLLKTTDLREQALPENHPDLATAYNNVGYTYGELGDHKKALEYKLKDLAICEQVLPENHPGLATSYNNVGVTYGELGDHKKALEYKLKALAIREQVLPENHPSLATAYNNAGLTYGELGDHQKALEYGLKALAIQKQALPENHPHLAITYNNVGATYGKLGNHEKDLEYGLKALTIREQALPENHPLLAWSNNNVGYTLIMLERYAEAAAYTRTAAAIAKTAFPEGHPSRANILKGAEIAEDLARRQAGSET